MGLILVIIPHCGRRVCEIGCCLVNRSLPILVVEPNPDYVFLLERAMNAGGITNPRQLLSNGAEAMDYLCGSGKYADRVKFPFPSVIITEIQTPLMGGLEILQWLRNHPECSVIPVLILTASDAQSDIKRAYQLGVNSYFLKPLTLEELQRLVKLVFDYWLVCEKPDYPPNC